MNAISTEGLCHRFSSAPVLRDVGLRVPQGSIYGFLGPNGAGKTTTLRLLLGLLRRQQGAIEIFGKPFERHRIEILRQVGSSIESPSLYADLTGPENLEVWRRIYRCSRSRIPEALSHVGLAGIGSKRVSQFSLGMKQRLAVAIALLHDPALLILDEPTNGLDPQGILDMRRLLAALNAERGTTVLISSHILSEVEKLVTHVGVIHRGTLKFQGTLDALRGWQADASFTALDTSDNAASLRIASEMGFGGRTDGHRVLLSALDRASAGRLTTRLAEHGITIYEIATSRKELEAIFLEMVGGD